MTDHVVTEGHDPRATFVTLLTPEQAAEFADNACAQCTVAPGVEIVYHSPGGDRGSSELTDLSSLAGELASVT